MGGRWVVLEELNREIHLITRNYNDLTFTFRADGYFNMTKAAACFGKDSRKFFITQDTKDYIDALTPNVPKTVQLVETKRGNGGGTWAHPKLAMRSKLRNTQDWKS